MRTLASPWLKRPFRSPRLCVITGHQQGVPTGFRGDQGWHARDVAQTSAGPPSPWRPRMSGGAPRTRPKVS